MSVVVAIKQDGVTYMAADTMVTLGDSKRHLTSDSSQKIWAVNDTANCIMGGAGFLRDINLIRYCTQELVPEANIMKEDLNVGVIMMQTVPVIFESIRNYAQVVDGEDAKVEMASSFLWAYKDHLFHIMPDGLVEEVDDYEAIGSGADAALASLKHTIDEPVYERLFKALEAASDISLYVAEPYVCIDTKNCELMDLSAVDIEDEDEDTEISSGDNKNETVVQETQNEDGSRTITIGNNAAVLLDSHGAKLEKEEK